MIEESQTVKKTFSYIDKLYASPRLAFARTDKFSILNLYKNMERRIHLWFFHHQKRWQEYGNMKDFPGRRWFGKTQILCTGYVSISIRCRFAHWASGRIQPLISWRYSKGMDLTLSSMGWDAFGLPPNNMQWKDWYSSIGNHDGDVSIISAKSRALVCNRLGPRN